MKNNFLPFLFILLFLQKSGAQNNPTLQFEIFTKDQKVSIIYDKSTALDSILAYSLSEDIFKVTGFIPLVTKNLAKISGNVIVIGAINSMLVNTFIDKKSIKEGFSNQW